MDWAKLVSFSCVLQVGYSLPSQPGIMRDLDLSLAEVPSCNRVFILLTGTTGRWVLNWVWACPYAVLCLWLDTNHWSNARSYCHWYRGRPCRPKICKCWSPIQSCGLSLPHLACSKSQIGSREIIMISSSHWALSDKGVLDFFCFAFCGMQTMAISDLLCILGYLLITFSQVDPSPTLSVLFNAF